MVECPDSPAFLLCIRVPESNLCLYCCIVIFGELPVTQMVKYQSRLDILRLQCSHSSFKILNHF